MHLCAAAWPTKLVCSLPYAVQNNKDYFDQSLDEIKLLKYVSDADPDDEHGMLRLYDYFYYKVSRTTTLTNCCNTVTV